MVAAGAAFGVDVGASVGIATIDGRQPACAVLAQADRGLYEAKRAGGHRAVTVVAG
ncbi:MAG TPA: hypothetical protein VD931_11850 [Baekduia sp.]|nr:hypothetical protein [Baekduia sp.]